MAQRYRTAWARRLPARMVREALHLAWAALVRIVVGPTHVFGREHIDDLEPPIVIVANHSSHLDTPVILNALPLRHRQRTLVVAAADYFYSDRLRAALVSLAFGTIPVERGPASTTESTDRMHRLLEEGWNLLLYPEGTRSRSGRMGELHTGAAHLAGEHGLPLMPIGITGTHASLPPGSWRPRRHEIHVRFGRPLDVTDDDDYHAVTDRLARALQELTGQG